MALLTRHWINIDYGDSDALRAQDIPYNATESIKDVIDARNSIDIIFGGSSEATPYWSTDNSTDTTVRQFIFRGTSVVGTPTKMKVLVQATSGGSGQVELYDLTNSLSIGTVTGVTSTTTSIQTDSSLTNLPTGEAIFEIRAKDANSLSFYLYSFHLEFN